MKLFAKVKYVSSHNSNHLKTIDNAVLALPQMYNFLNPNVVGTISRSDRCDRRTGTVRVIPIIDSANIN